MSRLGEFANIYELLDESDASGVETGKKAQVALAEKKAAAAAALAPAQPRPTSQTGKPQGQRPQGEQRQGGNGERGPRTDRPRGDRPPRTDRPPRAEGDRADRPPRGDRPPRQPRPAGDSPKLEGGENTFTGEGQAAAQGGPRPYMPRGERRGPRPDRGYERRNPGDQDQRPAKREYDRRSGTGRGKEVAKGGAGKGGWGSIEDEAAAGLEGDAAKAAETETKKEGEETVTTEGAAPAEGESTDAAATTEIVDDEPKTRTFEEFMTERKSKAGAALPPPRQLEDSGEWSKYEPVKKDEDSLFAAPEKQAKKKEAGAKKESTEKKVAADQVLKFQQERRERPERSDRPERADKGERRSGAPRGAPRGAGAGGPGNQAGQKRSNNAAGGAALKFDDKSAFPTLSTKA